MFFKLFGAGLALAVFAGAACGQVVINEVMENPTDAGEDEFWEYMELYGTPGMDLTGYALVLVKGGSDPEGDGVPNSPAEIDEAFSLDGLTIGDNGILVVYNNLAGFSEIGSFVEGPFAPAGVAAAGWDEMMNLYIPNPDPDAGNLANGDSSTYLLVRGRPDYSVVDGMSLYGPGYAVAKETDPDQDFNSRLDFAVQGFAAVDPLQIVDDVAWSNNGGKEYTRDSDQEISDTPDFNPDGLSRVAYYGENPMAGHRFNSDGEVTNTRSADEEFVYGNGLPVVAVLNSSFETVAVEMFYETGPMEVGAPTDPNGQTYDEEGNPDPMGEFLFDDIDVAGFGWTPGSLNDTASAGRGMGITQFRFVAGDVNFDGVADKFDYGRVRELNLAGATLDDRETRLNNNNTPENPADDFMYDAYVFEGRLFNGYLAAANIDVMDNGMGGNSDVVTEFDAETLRVNLGFGVAPDQDGDGAVGSGDLGALLAAWGGDCPIADVDADGVVGSGDLGILLASWGLIAR